MKVKRFIKSIPYWAYLPVLVVIFVHSINFFYLFTTPVSGERLKFVNGHYIIDYVEPDRPVEKAGIKSGDTIITLNSFKIEEWITGKHVPKVGDTLTYRILRNNQETRFSLIIVSGLSVNPVLFWSVFIVMVLVSVGSLYIIYKKPHDKATLLFFLYIQQFALLAIGGYWLSPDPLPVFIALSFQLFTSMVGPTLIHFHLLFPKPISFLSRFKRISSIFYILGFLIFILHASSFICEAFFSSAWERFSIPYDLIGLWWLTITFSIALVIAIYQFVSIKNTLTRNQLRIVVIGSFFGVITPIFYTIFYENVNELWSLYPNLIQISQGAGSLIMTFCILIAIFRYRIWDMEILIKKALLYLGATLIIIFSYISLISLANQMTAKETIFTRFLILAISVIVFLVLRDWMQWLIDRLFHREAYDSASVVSDFEEKLAGIYHFEELKRRIVQGIDEIFHFKSFVFNLKKNELVYEPVYVLGVDNQRVDKEFEVNHEFERMLRKSKIFSPEELDKKPSVLEIANGELIVPLLSGDQSFGFFLCGQKKSERVYSLQDIQVLSLLARRIIALFHTATLYQKDLDRQLILERERARISQDMHDDVGASLTRISILSDLAKNKTETGGETKLWLGQISDTSRDVIEEINQIIWTLNPKNDTLEGLIAYIRRFTYEYLEPTNINCTFDLPEILPNKALTVEVRRNVYLVVRESLHNMVKHSGAAKVWITMKMHEHGFKITIRDDGAGFDPGNLEFPGNGLINMRKRMKDIGGDFKITSVSGEGTEIELVIDGKT
jgi:signal transduction histidine kinase